jgi:hypothetical protein
MRDVELVVTLMMAEGALVLALALTSGPEVAAAFAYMLAILNLAIGLPLAKLLA